MGQTPCPFFSFSTSDFLRSIDKRMLVNVVNISFYFSVMRDRYLPPPTSSPGLFHFFKGKVLGTRLPPRFARFVTLSSTYKNSPLGGHCYPLSHEAIITFLFFNSKQRSLYLVLFLLNILTHYPACCSTEG